MLDIAYWDYIYCFVLCLQDALFFLKDFFSNMVAGINPYLPVDPAAEGKPERMKKFNFLSFSYAYVYKVYPAIVW